MAGAENYTILATKRAGETKLRSKPRVRQLPVRVQIWKILPPGVSNLASGGN